MKDWKVEKDRKRTLLMHRCPERLKGFRGYMCSLQNGQWYCGVCRVYAPEEISFCADLAGCVPYTKDAWNDNVKLHMAVI